MNVVVSASPDTGGLCLCLCLKKLGKLNFTVNMPAHLFLRLLRHLKAFQADAINCEARCLLAALAFFRRNAAVRSPLPTITHLYNIVAHELTQHLGSGPVLKQSSIGEIGAQLRLHLKRHLNCIGH